MIECGSSLPPGVVGKLVGTLTICVLECTIHTGFVRIQFWGDNAHFDLNITRNNSGFKSREPITEFIEFPLVGTMLGLNSYLKDASPLQIKILRYSEINERQHAQHLRSPSDEHTHYQVGSSYIPDVSIPELSNHPDRLTDTNYDAFSRKVKLEVFEESERNHVGVIVLELTYRIFHSGVDTPSYCVSANVAIQDFSSEATPDANDIFTNAITTENEHVASTSIFPVGKQKFQSTRNFGKAEETFDRMSSASSNDTREKDGLMEELLDLCADDMTIFNIDDSLSYNTNNIDPFDIWISRIVKNAGSPPEEKFSCFMAPKRSNSQKGVDFMKIEIVDISLSADLLFSRFYGKTCFFLIYELKSKNFVNNLSNQTYMSEKFKVGEHIFRAQSKVKKKGTKGMMTEMANPKCKKQSKDEVERLLQHPHSNQFALKFDDDDSLQVWLRGTIEFRLTYSCDDGEKSSAICRKVRHKPNTKVPSSKNVNNKNTCLAFTSVDLREFFLTEQNTAHYKLDLLSTIESSCENSKVGSLIMNITLLRANEVAVSNDLNPTIFRSRDAGTQTRSNTSQTYSPLYPFSTFLSDCVNNPTLMRLGDSVVNHSALTSNHEVNGEVQGNHVVTHDTDTCFKPINPPPIWIYVCVSKVSILSPNRNNSDDSDINADLRLQLLCREMHASMNDILPGAILSAEETAPEKMFDKIVHLKNGSVVNECSWQLAVLLNSGEKKTISVSIQVRNLSESQTTETLKEETFSNSCIGFSEMPVKLEQIEVENNDRILPKFIGCAWYSIIGSLNESSIGKMELSCAVGTLRQIRSILSLSESATMIQKWWWLAKKSKRKLSKSYSRRTLEQAASNIPLLCTSSDHSMNNAGILMDGSSSQNGTAMSNSDEQKSNSVDSTSNSSPDSLFEEWSKQPLIKNRSKASCGKDTNVQGHVSPSNESDIHVEQYTNAIVECPTDSLHVKSSCHGNDSSYHRIEGTREAQAASIGFDKKYAENTDATLTPIDACSNRFNCTVGISKINGLREIIHRWCQKEAKAIEPNYGVVFSFCIGTDEEHADDEELRRICQERNAFCSKVLRIDELSRDIDMDLFKIVSIPYESNFEMIQSQSLNCMTWFVPVITKAIAMAINVTKPGSGETDVNVLKGCRIMSCASLPLYHLYTPRGFFDGSIPWTISGTSVKNIGDIAITVHCDFASNCSDITFPLCGVTCTENLHHHCKSTMRSTKLQNNLSEHDPNPRKSIDPPSFELLTYKRKAIDANSNSIFKEEGTNEFKRCKKFTETRILTVAEPHPDQMEAEVSITLQATSIEENMKQSIEPSIEQSTQNMEILNEMNPGSVENCDSADDDSNCRSLSSVMESLEYINSNLNYDCRLEADHDSDTTSKTNHEISCNNEGLSECMLCPSESRKQIEVLSESTTQFNNTSKKYCARDIALTEVATSPIIVQHIFSDASTSPSRDSSFFNIAKTQRELTMVDSKVCNQNVYRKMNEVHSNNHNKSEISYDLSRNLISIGKDTIHDTNFSKLKTSSMKEHLRQIVESTEDETNMRLRQFKQPDTISLSDERAHKTAVDGCLMYKTPNHLDTTFINPLSSKYALCKTPVCDKQRNASRKMKKNSPFINNSLDVEKHLQSKPFFLDKERIEKIFTGKK